MTTTRQNITFIYNSDTDDATDEHNGHKVMFLEMYDDPFSKYREVEVGCLWCLDTFIAFSDELFITVKEN